MLTILGVLMYMHAIAFADDLELENYIPSGSDDFIGEAFQRYESAGTHN